jgi:hypothetical protein
MFQFSGLALFRVIYLQYIRLSHSEIFGLMLVCSYPKLIAAYHVLHRLPVPRHPPCALICFKKFIVALNTTVLLLLLRINTGGVYTFAFPICQRSSGPKPSVMCQASNLTRPPLRYHHLLLLLSHPHNHHTHPLFKKSGGYRIRTDDPLRARQVL